MKLEDVKKIVKWNDDFTGDGLRIAICELGLGEDTAFYYDKNINATNFTERTDAENKRTNRHTDLVGWIYRTALPEAEIFLLDCRLEESKQWIKDNNIHIVNLSISDTPINYYDIADYCFLVSSAGNSGPKGETMGDMNSRYWFQVGALGMDGEKSFRLLDYSSWGRDLVDGVMFAGIDTPYGRFHGTSCSGPIYGCIVGQYMGAFERFFKEYPLPPTTLDFIDRHSHNVFIFDPDSDLKIGYGLLVLPEKYHFTQLTFGFPKGQSTSHNTVIKRRDGAITTQKIKDPAIIMGGRTYLPLRATSKLIGGFIGWNDDKRLVEYYLQQGDH